uniref:Uncharacterized protein n=1 Tax=Wuchereria bancrofti TaxID=6293 RepID=A0AAF5PVD8_WUCBA
MVTIQAIGEMYIEITATMKKKREFSTGILSGYILSDREYYQTPPIVWFVPLGIAFATYTKYFNIGACPEKLLFVSVGLAAINQLLFGLIVGITFSYLCISAIYVIIGFFAMQFYIQKYRAEKECKENN